MRPSMFNVRFTTLWYRSANWLALVRVAFSFIWENFVG